MFLYASDQNVNVTRIACRKHNFNACENCFYTDCYLTYRKVNSFCIAATVVVMMLWWSRYERIAYVEEEHSRCAFWQWVGREAGRSVIADFEPSHSGCG